MHSREVDRQSRTGLILSSCAFCCGAISVWLWDSLLYHIHIRRIRGFTMMRYINRLLLTYLPYQPPPSCHTTTSSQHARLSGVFRRRSDGLECAAWRPPRPVAQCRQFPEEAKDASVSECTSTLSALEALRNALYKFKTYLLTYLPYWSQKTTIIA